ncbi:hypothetical protein GYMLUDRAFT_45015, partial [Collybiopsis luxurians FD-317 M1]
MADLGDFIALIVTIAVFAGIIYAIVSVRGSVSEGVKSTKDKLKEKGYDISDKGLAVKTSKRMNREDYVDATQRGLIRAMGAASFRSNAADGSPTAPSPSSSGPLLSAPSLTHSNSSTSISSTSSEKKKRSFFSKKKHD